MRRGFGDCRRIRTRITDAMWKEKLQRNVSRGKLRFAIPYFQKNINLPASITKRMSKPKIAPMQAAAKVLSFMELILALRGRKTDSPKDAI